jgi:biopolymer transport protein ExbD
MTGKLESDNGLQPLLRSKSYDESEMDITPMIDITFLLLIFFIVASKMDASADVKLPPARYGSAVVEKSSVVVTLMAGEGGKAIVFKSNGAVPGNEVAGGDMEAQEDEIANYVEQEIAKGDKEYVLIKAERGIRHREVARISKAATRSESVQQLFLAVLEVQ